MRGGGEARVRNVGVPVRASRRGVLTIFAKRATEHLLLAFALLLRAPRLLHARFRPLRLVVRVVPVPAVVAHIPATRLLLALPLPPRLALASLPGALIVVQGQTIDEVEKSLARRRVQPHATRHRL